MFAELNITSNFTFLTGASHPEEYIDRAALLGLPAIAIADENSVAGIVRAHTRAKEIARQVAERERLEAQGFIGPPAPMVAFQAKPSLWEQYPGNDLRRKAGNLSPIEVDQRPATAASAAITNIPRLLPAARLVLDTGFTATVLPRDRPAWGGFAD